MKQSNHPDRWFWITLGLWLGAALWLILAPVNLGDILVGTLVWSAGTGTYILDIVDMVKRRRAWKRRHDQI